MTQTHPSQRDTEEGGRRGKRTLALVTALLLSCCLSEEQVKKQSFFFFSCRPLSLSVCLSLSHPSFSASLPLCALWNRSSIVAASERLLWHLSEGRKAGGQNSPNKEIEQEKGKKGCGWRPLFFSSSFTKHLSPPSLSHTHTHTHPLLPTPCSFRLPQTKEAWLSQCAPSVSPAHFISALYLLLLREHTHTHYSRVCVGVCVWEFVRVVLVVGVEEAVYIC